MRISWPWDVADLERACQAAVARGDDALGRLAALKLQAEQAKLHSEQAQSHARAAQTQRAQSEVECDALRKRILGLQAEIEALKSPPAKPPLAVCPRCAGTDFYGLKPIVGWRAGAPDPRGATAQCLVCGAVSHIVGDKIEIAKEVPKQRAEEKRPRPPTGDSDLAWKSD